MSSGDRPGKPPRPAIDTIQSVRWRTSGVPSGPMSARPPVSGRPPVSIPASARKHRADPCAVEESDLAVLGEIHDLLRALNDAYAGGTRIEALVDKIPILRARCIRRAKKRFPAKLDCTLKEALTLIGNIGLESELLQLLEDLTILSSDIGAAKDQQKPPR